MCYSTAFVLLSVSHEHEQDDDDDPEIKYNGLFSLPHTKKGFSGTNK